MEIKTFFDNATFTLTYIVYNKNSKDAVIIDPVLDYDPASSHISNKSALMYQNFIYENGLTLHYCLETHAHADHLSSSFELKKLFPEMKVAINENIKVVQDVFKKVFNQKELATDGSQFDLLLKDKETLKAGTLEILNISTPGHTPACSTFKIQDAIFTGDALFMPDFGTGRCDFPAGSAKDLYHSIAKKLYTLADETRVFVGHDYQPKGRELMYETTIGESKKSNIHIKAETTEEEYVSFRQTRDAELSAPKLLLPSIQVNINAGELPLAEDNGVSYLKLPLT
jgi:glyoxylase-like metal-dependent hydrolase (beta-lactamase superfamily II)